MAFTKKTSTSLGSSTGTAKLDSSQIGKIEEAGYTAIPVSNNPDAVSGLLETSQQIAPGVSVPGYVDGNGNFYVVQENNVVHNIKYTGPKLGLEGNTGTTGIIPPTKEGSPPITGGPLLPGPPTLPPSTPPPINTGGNTPLPPPPPNLGSGRIFTPFEIGDVVPNQQEIVTRALWSGNVGNLTTFYTSSNQTTTQKRYYYEIFNSASGGCGAAAQFSVAWGHKNGSGSADEGGQINDTPSRAIYGQYRQLCLESGEERFTIAGSTTDNIYVINVNRARMLEYLDEGNIEINIHALSGSEFLAGGGTVITHTGSNVTLGAAGNVLRLIDDSDVASATIGQAGEIYNIVSGTIEDGIYNSSAPHYYGKLYKRLGVIVLDGNLLDLSSSFLTSTGSEINGDNAYKLFTAISGAALYTDASGDTLGFQGRSAEKVKSTHFFVRVKNAEYNFSNNPTFITGSEGDLAEPTFIGDPTVYITTVGLYNSQKELLATAKTSKPLKKNFTSEVLVKVKLDFVWALALCALPFLGI